MADFFDDIPNTYARGPRAAGGDSYSTSNMYVPPNVVNAVINKESGGRNIRGAAGEFGPMQVTAATAQRFGFSPESLEDPNNSVAAGKAYLGYLLKRYNGDLGKTLAAYNAGEGAVDRGKIPASTQKYVADIMSSLNRGASGAAPSVFSQTGIVPRGTAPSTRSSVPDLLSRLEAAWRPGTAEAAEGPLSTQIRSQAQPAGGISSQQVGTPRGAGAGFTYTPTHPDMMPDLRAGSQLAGDMGGVDIAQIPKTASMLRRGLENLNQAQYRTLMSGTPWTLNQQGSTAPQWIQRNLPGLAGLDASGKPLAGRQTMQKGADIAADVGQGTFQAVMPMERLLGMDYTLPGYVVSKGREIAKDYEKARAAERIAEMAEKGDPVLQDVRTARQGMLEERAAAEAAKMREMASRAGQVTEDQFAAMRRRIQEAIKQRGQIPSQLSQMTDEEVAKLSTQERAARDAMQRYLMKGLLQAGMRRAHDAYMQQQPAPTQPSAAPTQPLTMGQRFLAAWGPSQAEAAEPPGLAEAIAADKAKRGRAADPTADEIAAAKARRTGDESNAPWPVKAASYAPIVSQMIGEYGAGLATAPAYAGGPEAGIPAQMGAQAIGGGAGYGVGDIAINRPVRWAYGYPNKPWGQEAKDVGVAAAWSGSTPLIFKIFRPFLPASWKLGKATILESREAQTAYEDLSKRIEKTLQLEPRESRIIAAVTNNLTPQKLEKMLDDVQRKAVVGGKNEMVQAFKSMRDVVSAHVQEAASFGKTNLQKLARTKAALREIPDKIFYRLYNASRAELENTIDATIKNYGKFLKEPDVRAAVVKEIENAPRGMRQQIIHHLRWAFGVPGILFASWEHHLAVGVLGGIFLGGSELSNSAPARRIYEQLLFSKVPRQAALLTRALINALGTHMMTSHGPPPSDAIPDEPSAEPEAAPTPDVPRGTPTPRPDESTLEIQPPPPPEKTLDDVINEEGTE